METLYTVPQTAEKLGVTEKAVWSWVLSRKLGSVKIGRCRRIKQSQIEAYVENGNWPALETASVDAR